MIADDLSVENSKLNWTNETSEEKLRKKKKEEEEKLSLLRHPKPGPSMYLRVELPWNVLIPPENLDAKGVMLQRAIIVSLMNDFAVRKATKEHGYLLAITSLNSIGEGKGRQDTGGVLFPVVFSCITFKPFKGEILKGVVTKIMKQGVFLTCGPIENIYIPALTMPDYEYVQGENPVFMNDSLSKIESGVGVWRFGSW